MKSNHRGLCRLIQSGKFVRNLIHDTERGESGVNLPVTFSNQLACIRLPEPAVDRPMNCVVKMMYNKDPHVMEIKSMN